MKTRIVKLSNGWVAQVKKSWLWGWEGVDKDYPSILFTTVDYQLRNCVCDTKEKAEEVLNEFLEYAKKSENDRKIKKKDVKNLR